MLSYPVSVFICVMMCGRCFSETPAPSCWDKTECPGRQAYGQGAASQMEAVLGLRAIPAIGTLPSHPDLVTCDPERFRQALR